VRAITGIKTLKALAVETKMKRRWEEQLEAYVYGQSIPGRTCSAISPRQDVKMVESLVTVRILVVRRKVVLTAT